jgi:hypothetical protein
LPKRLSPPRPFVACIHIVAFYTALIYLLILYLLIRGLTGVICRATKVLERKSPQSSLYAIHPGL